MRVRYTRTAAQQIGLALDYLAAESPSAAGGLSERIISLVSLLTMHPYLGRMTSRRTIRRLPLGNYPYHLDYSVEGDEIVVRRFRHASRRPLL